MITKNPMQLKAFVKKKAAEKNISAQLVMQNYMLERLLERISLSRYKYNFILKGGFLISAMVGLDTRTTMDLDTTIKGFTLTHEAVIGIFREICGMEMEDDVKFELLEVTDIRASRELHKFWRRYQREFEYARDISFKAICETIQSIMKRLNKIENSEHMK